MKHLIDLGNVYPTCLIKHTLGNLQKPPQMNNKAVTIKMLSNQQSFQFIFSIKVVSGSKNIKRQNKAVKYQQLTAYLRHYTFNFNFLLQAGSRGGYLIFSGREFQILNTEQTLSCACPPSFHLKNLI